MRFRWNERTSGEDTDRDNLDLVGLQNQLIQRLNETGKHTVVIIISGRPLSLRYAAEHVPAIVNAWEPGQFGGQANAELLYGKVNPSAKLAMTIPRSVGQISTWYNYKRSAFFHPVVCSDNTPLYPFGYGLSYTTFSYTGLKLSKSKIPNDGKTPVTAYVTIENTGQRDGVEICQLYINDVVASVTRPVKELKDFRRVALKAGEKKTIEFVITPDKLAFYDMNMKPIVESGAFEVQVGSSSRDEDLQKATFNIE